LVNKIKFFKRKNRDNILTCDFTYWCRALVYNTLIAQLVERWTVALLEISIGHGSLTPARRWVLSALYLWLKLWLFFLASFFFMKGILKKN